jgi:cell division protease FtsH
MIMAKDLWLPKGYEIADGSRIHSLLFSGEDWQIYDTQGATNILIARPELAGKWCNMGLLQESLLGEIIFGPDRFRSLSSQKKYALVPVETGKSPDTKTDAIAFAVALKESRKLSDEPSLHDAIFVEQYSRLLPTWTSTPRVADDVVLGSWLSGGVIVSTDSFRRLSRLTGWMSSSDLADIVSAAGFQVPSDAGLLSKTKPIERIRSDDKARAESRVRKEPSRENVTEAEPKVFSLPGRPQLEEFFNDHVLDIVFNPEKYQALGIEFPSAIVLHGPPGCGKTFAAEQLVDFVGWPNFSINSNTVGSPYIHETSKKISQIFDQAIEAAPSIIIIDEMESFLSDRRSGGMSNIHHVEEVAEFLRLIPEAIKSRVLVIAMTNMIDMIDPAILRRGRFDHIIEVNMPSRIEVSSLLDSLLSKLPKSKDLNLEPVLDALTGRPLSDSAFVIREAARLAAKAGKSQLDQESLSAALSSLPEDEDKKGGRFGFL